MKFTSVVFATLFIFSSAWASKYIVIFKDSKSFEQVHSQWVLSNSSLMNRMFVGKRAPVSVEESLENLRSVVVDSRDEALVSGLVAGSDVVVEKEIFHKTPAPVDGFVLTSPWTFNAQYASGGENQGSEANTPWGIKAVKAREAWAQSNQGSGARVLVLDTGIDKEHPAVKNRIEATQDFVGDHQTPYDVADKVGHGTHVSGTILAEQAADGFSGVAPQAKLLMGRVCSEEGCSNIAIARGINWGIAQKVDVINMSLGGDVGTQAEKMAVEKAEAAGVVVVAASGNDGKPSVGFPAAYPTVIAVGAVDSTLKKADFSQWGPELDVVAPGVEVYSSVPMGSGCSSVTTLSEESVDSAVASSCFSGSAYLAEGLKKELMYAGLGKPEDFDGKDFSGKFALVSRGEIHFSDKVKNAMGANASGVIIYNNTTGLMSGSVSEDGSSVTIPVVMLEMTVGEKLKADLAAGKSAVLEVKTLATSYASFSGTSMATPHTTGVVALIRATNKGLTPAQVRNVLKASATELGPNTGNEYGAGLIDAEKAVAQAAQLK